MTTKFNHDNEPTALHAKYVSGKHAQWTPCPPFHLRPTLSHEQNKENIVSPTKWFPPPHLASSGLLRPSREQQMCAHEEAHSVIVHDQETIASAVLTTHPPRATLPLGSSNERSKTQRATPPSPSAIQSRNTKNSPPSFKQERSVSALSVKHTAVTT